MRLDALRRLGSYEARTGPYICVQKEYCMLMKMAGIGWLKLTRAVFVQSFAQMLTIESRTNTTGSELYAAHICFLTLKISPAF